MRTWRFHFAGALALLLLAGVGSQPGWAQRGVGQGQGKGQHRRGEHSRAGEARGAGRRAEEGRNPQREMRRMAGLPPRWMQRLQEMSPEEQERFLNNNERFKGLPPERQAQIRRRLQQWNSLTAEQQRALREREGVWERMSLEQRRRVREEILPRWQQLAPERRQAILRRLRELRDLTDSERAVKLNDSAFLSGLSPEEQGLLRDLSNLRVRTPEPPQDNPPLD